MYFLKCLVIVGLLVSCLIADAQSKKKASKINRMIRESLSEDELFQNVLKIFGWNLNNLDEDGPKKYCHMISKYEPALIGFQNVKIPDILLLKKCFAQLSKSCVKPRRRLHTNKKRLQRRHIKNFCKYEILGAGSSNEEETTFFTPIVFRQKRNIRTTGWNGTFWLSETPDNAFTKIAETSTFHIATWAYLKLAVAEKRERREQNAFERLLMVLKKSLSNKLRKKKRPTTKWLDLYVVNTQLDAENPVAAKKQLNILLQTLKEKKISVGDHAVILSIGVSEKIADDVADIMKTSGYKDGLKGSALSESTMVWSIGFDNVLSINVEINGYKTSAVLSALSFD